MADTQTIIETKILLEYVEKACQALFATFQSENREKGIKKLMEEKETEEKITKYAKESEINVLFIGCYPKETEEEEIFTLDLEVMYLGGKSTSIAFIKRFPIIKQDASLASQIHVMNIGEGSPFETIQNLMHYSVWPFFHSFDLKIREQSNQFIQNSKVKLQITQDAPAVKKKLAELELTLIQCQQNVEIPEVVLFIEPEITEIIQKAKENGTRVKLTDLGNSFDDPEFLTRVQNGVNKWITDIQKVTRMKRDVSSGTALQEINFWISLEKALKNIDKQVKTTETQLQLEFLNLKKKHFAGFAFESDTGLKKLLDTSENYNVLMKDFPLSEMLSAQDLDKIRESILRIFSHLRKLKNTNYPLQRALLFVESISRDFCLQVIRVLSSKNLLNLLFDEFDNLIAKSFDLFQTWEDQVTHLRDIIREIARRKGENKFSVRISTQIQPLKERLEQLRKFRKQHDQLQNVITRILPKTSTEFTEINAIEEVKEAYEYVRNVDPLSLSKEGNETWSESLKHYDTKIYSIEEQIIQILREKLEKAKKASEMFHVFSQFNVLFVRPKIRGAIQEYQTRLIERVKEDIQALHEKFKQQYIETETSKITEVRDIPPISGAIIWVKQIRNQLDTYIKRVGDVLGRSWENHIEGQKLKLDGENFKKKLNPQKIFDDWVRQVETRKWEVSGPVFRISKKRENLNLQVTFDQDIITLFKEVRNLQWLGFRVPFSIMHIAKNAGQVYPFAVSLIESIKNYFHICQTVDTEIFPLIASYRSQIQDSLKQGCSIGWDYIDLDSYVTELGNSILIFEEQVDGLINRYHDIKLSLEELKNCEFQAPNFENILSKIQKNVDELKSGSFSNLDLWINSLNQKIEQIFLQRLTDCLNAWNITFDEFLEQIELEKNPKKEKKIIQKDPNILAIKLNLSKMTFSINIKNRIIYLDPSFKEARENWISQLHKTIGIICNQKRIIILTKEKKEKKSRTKKTRSFDETKTYFNLVTFLPKGLLLTAYQKIELLLSQVEEYTKLWFKNQALWDIEPERVYKEVGDDLDKLKNLLLEIQTERSGLDTHSSSKDIGPITVDYSQIQTKVTNKYSAWHKNFLNKFAERLNSSMKEFHQTVADARTELEKHSLDQDTTSDIITFVTQLTHMRRNLNEWESAVDLYRSGEEILQKQGYPFGQNWLSYETVDGVWSSFNEIFSRKNSQINQEIPLLQHKIAEEDELLSTKLTSFNQDWEKDKPLDGKTKPSHAITKIAQFESRLNEIEEINNRIIKAKEALDMDVQDKNLFPPIREELVSLKQVWNELMSIWDKLEEIKKTPWSAIVPKKLRGSLDDLITQLRALPSKVRQYNAYEHFHSMIKGFLKCNVTIIDLKSESLKERHWKQIQNKLGVKWVFSELTLADIYNVDLIKNETIFKEVIRIAQGELALEKFLEQIKDHWQNYELELVNYRNKCKLIRGWDDLFTKISDHLNSLSAMKNSPFYKVFEEEAVGWEDKLNRVHLLFDTWIDVQRKWVYLEGVFCGSADIQQLLPQESSKFRNIDNDFLITMKKVVKSPHILDVLNLPGIQNSLERLSDMLSKIQKALGEYLEKQRSAFPRFYFVGDEDLLEIIGHSKDVLKIQRHLRKMFAGIALLKLSDDETSIIGMLSREHEEINFPDPIKYKEIPKIHEWLSLVENQMRVSLGNCLDISLREFIQLSSKDELDKDLFLKWVETTPAQIIVLTIQAIWTQKVENALSNKSETLLKKTLDWIGNILDLLAFNVLFDLQPITRSKYEHLIIELIHQRDVIRRLIQTNVRTLDNFSWIQEMRFYWNEKESHEKKLMISIANASFAYGFEYLGVVDKLVQTPLTDRCYLTLTQALNLRLGGAPAGPAGTGKSLRNSTIVYTPNGPKLNGDLQIGDEVCTPDGKFAKILAVYPQGKIGVFRVHFKDGGFVDCSDDHLWSVDHSSKIITTQEMRRFLRREEKISIETPKYTNFKTQKTKISPYLFGVLIAGNEKILENQNIKISNSINKQIFQNIQHLLNLTSDGNYEIYYDQINDYMPKLSQNKFIPNEFQFNSKEIRFQLLQGILDRNGYFDSKTNSPIYSTSSQQLAFDLKKLIESLGGICYISRTKQNEEIIFNCRIEIEKPEKLFTLNDKILIAKKSKKFINERFVSKIEYICKDECQCILIDHPDHLFITENHIVTHNTETVKALGNQLGRFVLVFNCDENFDFQAMGRIFVGLCQCGAWGCFDEFNRLEERMLSAVSQQIQTIQLSLKEQLEEVELIGRNVKINPNMGIFITMNPGYTGRVQLPENLKTLFRTISVVKPDRELIAQVMLFSQGFKTAEKLSGKVVPLFNLCADQLSQQTHYDFGLRALKSVLVSAGNIKRLEIKDKKQDEVKDKKQLGEEEKSVVIKSICETVIPKLVADDIPLLHSLLSDVFPGALPIELEMAELRNVIYDICKKHYLVPGNRWIEKMLQLFQLQKIHHGVMMVGPSGSGKSTAWKILLEALERVEGIKSQSHVIDPKAITKEELFGVLDPTTREWTDGIFTHILRKIVDNVRGELNMRHWIIFDGDVDSIWVENLNSVLDDNKILTLPNGERVALTPNVRVMFEVQDLRYATPATVSRCGMVWFSDDIISLDMNFAHYLEKTKHVPLLESEKTGFEEQLSDEKEKNEEVLRTQEICVDVLRKYFDSNGVVIKAIDYASKKQNVMDFTNLRSLTSAFSLLDQGINHIHEYNSAHVDFSMKKEHIQKYVTKRLLFSLIWGFGGSMSLQDREEFGTFLLNNCDIQGPKDKMHPLIDFEVQIDDGEWILWKNRVPNLEIETYMVASSDVVIPTVDTLRHEEVVNSWLKDHLPLILCGPPGSGKSLRNSATVYTPNGPKINGKLKIGDVVCTPDGKTSKIIGIYPQGKLHVYRVKFEDGDFVDCSADHLWTVNDHSNYKKQKFVLTTQQIIDNLQIIPTIPERKGARFSIDTPKPILFMERNVPFDPYLLGVLIGKEEIYIGNENIEKQNHYKEILEELGLLNQPKDKLFIPQDYIFNSKEIRLEIIKGLLDSNSSINYKDNSIIFKCKSTKLSQDFKKVIQSLGGMCSIETNSNKTNLCKIFYKTPKELFKLSKNKDKIGEPSPFVFERRIISIECVGEDECTCITIDHPEELYLTDNFVVTHNTMTLYSTLRSLPNFEVVGINFSSATTPELVMKTLTHYCKYQKTPNGVIIEPKSDKWLVIFCDEINLPKQDRYGTQKVITFLRQLVERGGFWRISDYQWVTTRRIQFVGACNPPTMVGRVPLSHRFLRHAPVILVDYPSADSLKQIYGTFNRAVLRLCPSLKEYSDPLTDAMVEFYSLSQQKFTQDMQPHYVYSPRELSRWTRSLREILKPLGGDLDLDGLVRIFVHEGLRLFQDRLVYKEERDWTDEQLDSVSKKYFPGIREKTLERPILFSDWLSKDYMDVDREKLREHVKARLKVFYEEELNVKLVLFNEALDHILRIDRVLKQPQGHCLLIGSSGAGKCLDPNTPVMLYNGKSKLAKNIKVNDQLMGDDSNPRNVLSICKGRENMYRIKQSNGDEYIVNEPHILSLKLTINSILNHEKDLKRYSVLYFENHCEKIKYFNYGKKRKLSESKSFTSSLNALHFANKFINQILESKKYNHKGDVIDIAVIDYIKKTQIWKKYHAGFKVPIQFNSNPNIPIDPYNLGIYLGMENNKSDKEIKIPQCYKINDRETRLNILAGLIDSNDEIIYDEMNNCYNIPINENQEELYKDIQFISRSLGFSCEKEKEKIIISGNEIEEIPVRNPNKKIKNQNKTQNSNLESEIEVELIGEGDYCGFEIDGNRRFLLGDFTVTHNTVLSRFVAWINGLSVFQIKISRKYTLFDFDEDLRVVMKRAGIKGEKICFIFDESNILETSFLERMNALLASGEVPGLFEGDEMGALMNQCREAAQSDGAILDTNDELFNWFTKQVQNNLHIVFTMNPATGDFSNRAATSPALFNRCVLDWFGDWSPSAMYQVGYEFTKDLNLENPNYFPPISFPHEFDAKDNFPDSPNHRESIVSSFVTIHKSVEKSSKKLQKTQGRSNYVTPRHYLDFITHYLNLFNEKRSSLEEQQHHLDVGLKKMKETEEEVAKLQLKLKQKEKELESKNEEAEAKLKQMVKDQQEAEAKRKASLEIQTKLEEQNKEIAAQQKIAMDDLSKAEPAVLAAKKSVNSIKKSHLEELKSMSNPPELVKMTLQAVSQFLGSKETSWGEIRRLLRKDDFIPSVVNFDTNSMTSKARDLVSKALADPKFTFENVNRASRACGPMQKWLEAQVQYSVVLEKVDPLKKQVASLEEKANILRDKQKELNDMIENLEKSIQRYTEEYAQLISQTQEIKSEMNLVSQKVERSIALMKSLSSEQERWSLESQSFQQQMSTVPGDVLLSASFLTYIGFFDQHYRQVLMNIWKKHLMTVNIKYREGLSLIEYLSVPDDRLIWQSNSLPADDLCTENAIILTRFNRYPLVIDPSGQATEFLMRQFESSKITKTSFLDDSFMKNLESALRFGTAILLQDVENIDPILNPVLNKEFHKSGGGVVIRLGDQEIYFSPSFNLFMTTRDPSFNFTPDLCSRVTFCNFTVTLESLQAQCLNHILRNERPDIDQQRSDILKLQGEYKVRLRNLEKSLLDALNKVEGNILDDDSVFNSLERLKTEAAEVAEKANQADQTLANITKISAKYEPFALSSSRIYFTLEQLSSIHYLYQYSLNFFLGIFFNVVNTMNQNIMNVQDYEERLKILTHDLFKVIYRRVSYGLLHKDRLTFALRLAQIYLKQMGQDFDEEEMNLLLRSDIILSPNKLQDKIDNSYYNIPESVIPSSQIKYLQIISELPSFKDLPSHIRKNQSEWKNFIKSANPESNIPENWEELQLLLMKQQEQQQKQQQIGFSFSKSTEVVSEEEKVHWMNVKKMLKRLLLLKFFRPDRVLSGTSSLIETVFGYNIQSIPELNLKNVIEKESNAREPLLLCTQPGYDPSTRVDELANELGVKKQSIAIGSQESYHHAEQAIETAAKIGSWVLIKNVHLAPPWLNQIEKRVRNINPEPGFRLFMTSEFNPKLPVNFLRLCQIFVFEAPPGIKANLSHTFSLLSSKRVNRAPVERARMHFILSWLHAVIQERLRYVPLGWSKIYEFNEADQRCSLDSIDYWVGSVAKGRSNVDPEKIPWIAIRTILGQVMYGGRIDNDFDQRLLDSMLEKLFVPKSYSLNFKLIEYDSLTEDGFDKFSLEIPEGTKMEHFADWIEKLPKNENPAWLGLPAKAELLLLANQGKETLGNFLKMENIYEEEKSDIEKEKKEDRRPSWMKKLEKSTREWIDILPKSLDSLKKTESSIKDPLFRCFNREIIIGKKLLNKVREDLEKILLLCQGKQKHTNYLRGLIRDLTQATIPSSWRVYSVANIPVGIWIVDFSKRIKQLQKIILSKNYCLDGIWLGGLFSPEAFITATRQSAAQSNMWSLETLKLEIEIGKFTQSKFKNTSFFVDDFTLEGAIWKNNCLAISSDISNPLPRVQLRWVPNQENELNVKSKVGSDLINLPVYLNNTRKELLFSLDLTTPKDVPIQTWYQRGTALIVWSSPD